MNRPTCPHCSKTFCNGSTKNRHIRNLHLLQPDIRKTNNHIFCALCPDDSKKNFESYSLLMQHITDVHNAIIKEEKLCFSNYDEFENWRTQENRNVNYTNQRVVQNSDKRITYYNCNRSNSQGFKSNSIKRMQKKGGSIKINGICPSRIIAHHSKKGQVVVHFVKTHIGHIINGRNQQLTRSQQDEIVKKLKAGVKAEKIIKDAQETKGNELGRINVLTKQDLLNLQRKFNISRRAWKARKTGEKLKDESENLSNVKQSEEKLVLKEVAAEKHDNHEENLDEATYRKLTTQTILRTLDNLNFETFKKTVSEVISILKIHSEDSTKRTKN